jgi:acyl-coenzyme A thioesterase PaaI-like protein
VPYRDGVNDPGNGSGAGGAPPDQNERPWAITEPGQLVGRGHGAGDVLEAWRWRVLERGAGLLLIEAHLPEQLKNPQGQLFGGFTTTYIDFVSLHTVHASDGTADPTSPRDWLTTINLRCDYFEPIVEETFTIRGELINQRGATSLVSTRFFQGHTMAAHGLATLRKVPIEAPRDEVPIEAPRDEVPIEAPRDDVPIEGDGG